ncbi:MAG TPA: phosphodiester glycosidase family protein [Clostridium sp.]
MTKKKKVIISVSLIVIIMSTIVFSLAYRYLIEREETPLSTNNIKTITQQESNINTSEATYDDWSYKRSDLKIKIEKVESGSGNDKVTYFVADVQIKDTSDLYSAFAKNKFGRNIVQTTSSMANDNDAIFAINGDYYGFREDGILIRNGVTYRDTATRDGLAFYDDGTMKTYDETSTSADELISSGVLDTFSFGPTLVENSQAIRNFNSVKIDKNMGNSSIQNSNPRTGVGIISPNHYVFVVVDGRKEDYSKGMTLNEFAQVFEELGCTDAYNLDGGGSSTMYFMGRVVNNPLGKSQEREVSDIIYFK